MKKLLIAGLIGLSAITAAAKTADELRVYINPGHGSWTADDRPMAILGHAAYNRYATDTLSFFESNTNLRKGFGVLEKLRAAGLKFDPSLNQTGERNQIGAARDMSNNIVMSHVKCGPFTSDNGTTNQFKNDGKTPPADQTAYNRSLSEICVEVESNNFDMFISIHSNAVDGSGWKTTNFPIILYRGYDDVEKVDDGINNDHARTSKAMSQAVWAHHIGDKHGAWTAYNNGTTNIRGDLNFYGSGSINSLGHKGYLGVLKHGVPGFLVEGYFHQYAPAALRHMNWDVDYIEGYNYGHGIADFFGLTKEKTGDIYGIVRDEHEKFNDPNYVAIPGKDDMYKPLNGVVVTLKKDGAAVATYTTDNQYNGCFVFKNVEPGKYTLSFAAEGYKTPKAVEVEVAAAQISYPSAKMESESYVAPTINYVNYPDELKGTAYGARTDYTFAAKIQDKEIAELAGLSIKRIIPAGDNLYVYAVDADTIGSIFMLNAKTLDLVSKLSTAGINGRIKPIGDIALTADGALVACDYSVVHFNDTDAIDPDFGDTERGIARVYRWNVNPETGLPEGDPYMWFSTLKSGNFYRAASGISMVYTGTTKEGTLILTDQSSYGNGKYFFSLINIMDNEVASEEHRNNLEICDYFNTAEGGNIQLHISPLADRSIIANSPTRLARQYCLGEGSVDMAVEGEISADKLPMESAYTGFFKYSGNSYMVAPAIAEGKNTGVVLLDITNGLDSAVVVETYNTALEGLACASAAAGRAVVKRNELDQINGAGMELFLARDNKFTLLSTEGVRQLQPKREFAYDIVLAQPDAADAHAYTLTFKATGNAPEATLVLTDTGNAADVQRLPIGAVNKGENSFSFNSATMDGHDYSVAVEIVSKPIAEAAEYFADNNGVEKRGGIVTITDPDAESFGYTVAVTGGAGGFKVYAPDGTVSEKLFVGDSRLSSTNQSSPFRGDERNGLAVFADWSDVGAGYWTLDPKNPTELKQLLGGERSGTAGSYAYNGTIFGGGSSCVAFQGKGENQKMYSFLEDYPAGNMKGAENYVYRYTIGTGEQLTTIPDKKFDNLCGGGKLSNQNVEVHAVDHGFFAAQVRSEGNNLGGTPCFLFCDNEGNELMNSAELKWMVSGNSGIAVSKDGKLAAIGQHSCITIASIEWVDGEPVFTQLYDIPTANSAFAQYKFDIAGNLHTYSRELGGYHAYSLPAERPAAVSPAASKYIVKGNGSGVENVVPVELESAAVYYDLNGVQVSADRLSSGIYIKVQGKKATKVVVR